MRQKFPNSIRDFLRYPVVIVTVSAIMHAVHLHALVVITYSVGKNFSSIGERLHINSFKYLEDGSVRKVILK
jgi:hypothetical protein